jgi:4'-phosphopantetheinyl transferase
MIKVLFADVSGVGDEMLGKYFNTLPAAVQQTINAYTDAHARRLRLCGKVLLQLLMADMQTGFTTADVYYNQWGKPVVDGPFSFSIAHSGNMVVCAVGNGAAIGIDIEAEMPMNVALFRDYFSPQEWELICSATNPVAVFYGLWVRKEAVVKAAGAGMPDSLAEVCVLADVPIYNGHSYHLRHIEFRDGYAAAIACGLPFTGADVREAILDR